MCRDGYLYVVGFVFLLGVGTYGCAPANTDEKLEAACKSLWNETGKAYYAADFTLALALADSAIAIASTDPMLHAKSLNRKAQVLIKYGDLNASEQTAKLALAEAEKSGDLETIGDAHNALGNLYSNKGNLLLAIDHYKHSLATAQDIPDSLGIGVAFNNLGICLEMNGYYPEALDNYRQALETFSAIDSTFYEALTLGNIAVVHNMQENYQEAISYQKKANAIAERTGNTNSLIYGLGNIAAYYNALEKPDEALAAAQRAMNLIDQSDYIGYKHRILSNMSKSQFLKKDIPQAMQHAAAAWAIVRDSLEDASPSDRVTAQHSYAAVLLESGDWVGALRYLDSAKAIADTLAMPETNMSLLETYQELAERQGDCAAALKYSKARQEIHDEILSETRVEATARESIRLRMFEQDRQLAEQKLASARQWLYILLLAIVLLIIASALWIATSNAKRLDAEKQLVESKKRVLEETNAQLVFEKAELAAINDTLQQRVAQYSTTTMRPENTKVEIRGRDKLHLLDPENILYVAAEDEGVRFFLTDGSSIWSDITFKECVEQLPTAMFIQIFRSTIVNEQHITWVNHRSLRMVNGAELTVSRTYGDNIKERFGGV